MKDGKISLGLTNMKVLAEMVFGSRLYGLDSPDSDKDFKFIFLPSKEECLLGNPAKNIHEKRPEEKIEKEGFSLQEFIKHLYRGEGYALDIIHAEKNNLLITSKTWGFIVNNRNLFYTKKMTGALGYAKNQASKYSLKAERLNAVHLVLKALKTGQEKGAHRIFQIWEDLPKDSHIYFGTNDRNNNKDNRYIEVAGKELPATIAIEYAIDILEKTINSFGIRVKMASELNSVDVKSLSHSFRIGFQLRDIYKEGDFAFPLKETEFLRDVKFRRVDFETVFLEDKLNSLISEVENLAEKSNFPEKANHDIGKNIILAAYE